MLDFSPHSSGLYSDSTCYNDMIPIKRYRIISLESHVAIPTLQQVVVQLLRL